ncbi:MAG TPA: protease pro-enzyme activation domain-containing protein [Candidatus Baltobacteraceae bacterium]|jgi:subtilase family serine protease
MAAALVQRGGAAPTQYTPPLARLAGMHRLPTLDAAAKLHVEIELTPKDSSLDTFAVSVGDPSAPEFHRFLSRNEFTLRFGRSSAETDALAKFLNDNGAEDVYVSSNRLVVGGTLSIANAERAFHTTYATFQNGPRIAVAPTTAITLPVGGIRMVRGIVTGFSPHLAQANTGAASDFRGAWYEPDRFAGAYNTLDGAGAHLVLIEEAADRYDPADVELFLKSHGAPKGASMDNIHTTVVVNKRPENTVCERDDRGQEATLDIDSVLTIAPLAHIEVRYDDLCTPGNDGSLALQRALDDPATNEIVFPFAIAPVLDNVAADFGPTPIPYLEAAAIGVPILVPSGDDGQFGTKLPGQTQPAVTYPCVLSIVICVGGTQIGERRTGGPIDEGPWNDGLHASGGGVSTEPRPAWQNAQSEFELGPQEVKNRIVPDISADASGHIRVFWHKYGSGGIGGTSESVAIAGAQIAAINAKLISQKQLIVPADLYLLAAKAPQAFRDITRDNDRGFKDNNLRNPPKPLPLKYKGIIPTPEPIVYGCPGIGPRGCEVKRGFDAVTGIGTLLGQQAYDALK